MEGVVASSMRGVGPLYVASYAWSSAVSFGLAVADVGYAGMLRSTVDSTVAAELFARMADFLVFTTGVTLLAGVGALVAAWESRPARNLVTAALALGSAGLCAPAVLPELGESGTALRLLIGGGTSVLAFLALHHVERSP